jgi:hypothetical protein
LSLEILFCHETFLSIIYKFGLVIQILTKSLEHKGIAKAKFKNMAKEKKALLHHIEGEYSVHDN